MSSNNIEITMKIFSAFLITFLVASQVPGIWSSSPQNIQWTRDVSLENGFQIRWSNADTEYLVMEMFAPVKGYVAVGFSPNGAMQGSDIVMGWVDSSTGEAGLKDLYAIGNAAPLEDDHHDYELLWAEETESGTTIRFRRKWNTCDTEHDFEINDDTVRLIWAVSDVDPVRRGVFQPRYHGPDFRGGRSVYLKTETHLIEFPDDALIPDPSIHFWDIKMQNSKITGDLETNYRCKIFKAPQFTLGEKKHQIIGYRPLLEKVTGQYVHHINLFECFVPADDGGSEKVFEQYLDHSDAECFTINMPPQWSDYCTTTQITWASGAEGLMLPEIAGSPLHEAHNGTTYFMMETHYDNPKFIRFEDSSGLRLFVTENAREYDYGSMTAHTRFGQFHMIPPGSPSFRSMAYCTEECTRSSIPPQGVTVTHALLHAHLTAKKLILRHIRDGKELPPFVQDLNYDFNYQQTRAIEPRKFMPGDILLIDCWFDTTDRKNITYGGPSSRDEMCQGYINYYPKIPLFECKTAPAFHNFFDALGIHKVDGEETLKKIQLPFHPKPDQIYDPGDDAYVLVDERPLKTFDFLHVVDPPMKGSQGRYKTVREYVNEMDWTKNDGELTKKVWKQWWEGDQLTFCTATAHKRVPLKNYIVRYPDYEPYRKATASQCLHQISSAAAPEPIYKFFGLTLTFVIMMTIN